MLKHRNIIKKYSTDVIKKTIGIQGKILFTIHGDFRNVTMENKNKYAKLLTHFSYLKEKLSRHGSLNTKIFSFIEKDIFVFVCVCVCGIIR